MLEWSVELEEFDIQYIPRISIKAQAIIDFISELTPPEGSTCGHTEQQWSLYVDGSTNAKEGGVGLVLEGLDG